MVFYTDYIYDVAKPALLVTEMEYEEDYVTGDFAAVSKGTYTYDEKDQRKEILWKVWEDGEWLNNTHLFYEFTNGIETREEGFIWNGEEWELQQRWEGEFDSEGRELKSRFYYPDATTKEPVLSSIYTSEYDANGNRTLYQLESLIMNGSSKELVIMLKQIAQFDDASRQTLDEQYEYNYLTGFGGVSKEVAEYTGYEDNVAWYASYVWKEGEWFPQVKEVNSYENNIPTGVIRFGAGTKADEWVEQEKYAFSYNENGNMSRQDYYLKDKSGNWALEVYLLYYYPLGSGMEITNADMAKISAINGVLDISGIRNHALVQVYTLSGQLVHRVTSLGNHLSLSLPQGLYLVSIDGKSVKVLMR